MKRRSEFSIEFKTTHPNGIIFYVANDRNVDFIALFMKNGRVGYLYKSIRIKKCVIQHGLKCPFSDYSVLLFLIKGHLWI